MSKIPKITKFRGDNNQSWVTWIAEFEAHVKALGVTENKYRDILLCSTESTAFTFLAQKIFDDTISYNNVKVEMKRRFFEDDFRRTLQNRFGELVFGKGMPTNVFIDDLSKTIRELFDIGGKETIISIAINHVISNLEEDLRKEAKMFQLTGNKSLEVLLEFAETKMEGNHFKPKYEPSIPYGSVSTATNAGKDGERLDRLEQIVNNIAIKLDILSANDKSQRNNTICSFCKKVLHEESRCFKNKKCNTCGVVRHIARFYKSTTTNNLTPSLTATAEDKHLVPSQITIV